MGRLDELNAKIDAFFTRVEDRHGADMQCQTGCSDCCHVRLTVTGTEAQAIADAVATWPAERRATLVLNARRKSDQCAALDPAGRCLIYDVRPVVCRSHGVPIRMQHKSLPVVQSCHRNFTTVTPDPDCVLDQATLSAMVLALDRAEGRDGRRTDLAMLLATM